MSRDEPTEFGFSYMPMTPSEVGAASTAVDVCDIPLLEHRNIYDSFSETPLDISTDELMSPHSPASSMFDMMQASPDMSVYEFAFYRPVSSMNPAGPMELDFTDDNYQACVARTEYQWT